MSEKRAAMNTLEILYQAFRVRYSLNQLQQILDRGCRLAVVSSAEGAASLQEFLGEPIVGIDDHDPKDDLIKLSLELSDEEVKELQTCDACMVFFDQTSPEREALERLAERIPLDVKTLWLCQSESGEAQNLYELELDLPTVHGLPTGDPKGFLLRLILGGLPQVSLVLARDWSNLRDLFCKILTRRTALRNGVRAGISSLPLSSVPGIGPVLSMLATSAETLMLTSSQLRLSFVIAAVHGRPLDFFDRITELWPIVGGAFGLRNLSRRLVKALPGGFRPGTKASIAFAGTMAVGEASRLFYHMGQPASDEVRRELIRRSHEEGAREAQLLFRRVLAGQSIDSETYLGEVDPIELVDGLTNLEAAISDPVLGDVVSKVARPSKSESVQPKQAVMPIEDEPELASQERLSEAKAAKEPTSESDAGQKQKSDKAKDVSDGEQGAGKREPLKKKPAAAPTAKERGTKGRSPRKPKDGGEATSA